MTHTYSITGMTCTGCVARIKSELLKLGEVRAADVQLQSPQATIVMNHHIPVSVLQEAIRKAGNYSIRENNSRGQMNDNSAVTVDTSQSKASYLPIFLIFGYIAATTMLIQVSNDSFDVMTWMRHFMAGFFLVFSFFKLMNLSGFAEGYKTYDVVAKQLPVWGFIYPFVELTLGVLFLTGFEMKGTTIATALIMGVSTIGVIQSLVKNQRFQCACLGTVIKLPLSKVTLFEDLLMVAMSLIMIAVTQ